ncbi:hypothetical protein HPP92_028245 [Vanilla planifolia]|uniref:Uncharacterized protein n=1 Tax=Vanilla planifolia TaxID=51239 RepID=A0A835P802_VANPL|nr:hypothetical protein HPP92_028245 [Vanilla planifolia]
MFMSLEGVDPFSFNSPEEEEEMILFRAIFSGKKTIALAPDVIEMTFMPIASLLDVLLLRSRDTPGVSGDSDLARQEKIFLKQRRSLFALFAVQCDGPEAFISAKNSIWVPPEILQPYWDAHIPIGAPKWHGPEEQDSRFELIAGRTSPT